MLYMIIFTSAVLAFAAFVTIAPFIGNHEKHVSKTKLLHAFKSNPPCGIEAFATEHFSINSNTRFNKIYVSSMIGSFLVSISAVAVIDAVGYSPILSHILIAGTTLFTAMLLMIAIVTVYAKIKSTIRFLRIAQDLGCSIKRVNKECERHGIY